MRLTRSIPVVSFISLFMFSCADQQTGSAGAPGVVRDSLIGSGPFGVHGVASANPKTPGVTSGDVLPPELIESLWDAPAI
jgi:hypothetical protein